MTEETQEVTEEVIDASSIPTPEEAIVEEVTTPAPEEEPVVAPKRKAKAAPVVAEAEPAERLGDLVEFAPGISFYIRG